MDSIFSWFSEHGLGQIWTSIQPYLPLVIFIVFVIIFVKFIAPKITGIVVNAAWAIIGIAGVLIIASYVGVSVPFFSNLQVTVTNWFDTSVVPFFSHLIDNIHIGK